MDKVTVRVMSCSCKMADITEQGVSCKKEGIFLQILCFNFLVFAPSFSHSSSQYIFLAVVEDLYKRRQPLPSMDAIYFIQPTKEK